MPANALQTTSLGLPMNLAAAGNAAGLAADRTSMRMIATRTPGAAVDPKAPLPTLGVLVAQTFLRAVAEGDLSTALPLCAQRVDFDGEVAVGAKAAKNRLEEMAKRAGEGRPLTRIVVMRLERARQLFGPPPRRLSLPPKTELLVGFGRFPRGGLIVFLAPEEDRWRVVALTD